MKILLQLLLPMLCQTLLRYLYFKSFFFLIILWCFCIEYFSVMLLTRLISIKLLIDCISNIMYIRYTINIIRFNF